jgi:hypothetical protein
MAGFDIEGARKAGYSESEIADHLATSRKFNIGQARQAGYGDAEIVSHLAGLAPPPDKPLSVRAGEAIREIPRQVGLTARYGIEGAAALPAMIADIPGRVYNLGATGVDAVAGTNLPRAPLAADAIPAALDMAGLPQPRGADERVVGDITRTMAGAGSFAKGADMLARGVTGGAKSAAQTMAANPGQQVAAGAGAGAAGGSVREAGGGPWEQAIAALVGGVAGGVAGPAIGNKAQATLDAMRSRVAPPSPQAVDVQIDLALRRQGIDYAALAGDVKSALRAEVADALRTGGTLRPETVARLADFRTVGATPTRGTITLDPVQLTREKNLAKTGANSTDVSLQRLAGVENENNRVLIDALNKTGANTTQDTVGGARQVIGTLEQRLAAQKGNVDRLYEGARDSAGRSFPLDHVAFTNRANNLLDDALVSAALPVDVRNAMNRIARGEMPFTVDQAEMLKTRIGDLQRGEANGNIRKALGFVRQAIDESPIMPLGQQSGPVGAARANNPGNLPYVPGSTSLGDEAVASFNKARAANREMMQRIESTPALKAVYEGVEPDKFVQTYITGQGKDATIKGVTALRDAVADDAGALQAIRGQIAAHLKGRALNGAADEVGNFSAANYDAALKSIGREKLALFFSREEIAQLEAAGRVARYTQVQPRGSAVNNSNSGALIGGRGLDLLDQLAGRMPIGQDTIRGFVRGAQQSSALNTSGALVAAPQSAAGVPLRDLMRTTPAPALMGTALSTLPGVPRREDDRRK